MRMRVRRRPLFILLLALGGCASAPRAGDTGTTNRSVITSSEIPTGGTESAFDLIQRLRPEYLRPKPAQDYNGGNSNAPPPSVFLNGQRIGEAADLRQIPAQSLAMVRYYTIEEGKRKFGMQNIGGVIEIAYRVP